MCNRGCVCYASRRSSRSAGALCATIGIRPWPYTKLYLLVIFCSGFHLVSGVVWLALNSSSWHW
ncbi:hypothetical protein TSAR_012896 [Trichomalopsis sarcophagae]|uniref:Uncharacterized protein n=1 Tax=Trichomalopsis sarcophagae TaxID=543379 RepID=A0A232F2T7_9HYME|nr:hypothetical protein TSAR_012896 [Trichomalopsis sarcophagae]